MKDWWDKKKVSTRKWKKRDGHSNGLDFFLDVLLWIPEFILFPFRLTFWLLRGIGRFIRDIL